VRPLMADSPSRFSQCLGNPRRLSLRADIIRARVMPSGRAMRPLPPTACRRWTLTRPVAQDLGRSSTRHRMVNQAKLFPPCLRPRLGPRARLCPWLSRPQPLGIRARTDPRSDRRKPQARQGQARDRVEILGADVDESAPNSLAGRRRRPDGAQKNRRRPPLSRPLADSYLE